ncbi:hypothetical protein ACWEO5_36470, partial [Kitasatospora sp. NPDC004272]
DARLLPAGHPVEVRGATEIAAETRACAARIALAVPLPLPGRPTTAVIAPGGRPYALIRRRVAHGPVTRTDITPLGRPALGPDGLPTG